MSKPVSTSGAPDDLVELGRIVSAYGIRGWVKIQPYSAQADVLRDTAQWWLTRPVPLAGQGVVSSSPFAVTVQAVRPQGSSLVAQLQDLDDRDQAEALKGHVISVSRRLFPAAEEDEYYWVDLIGCSLMGVDEADQPVLIGEIQEVLDNGAHGVLKVHLQKQVGADEPPTPVLTAKGRPEEMLVPFVGAHIQSVDLQGRRVHSNWPVDF